MLREKVKGSGVLLLIMSPHYLKSAWCGDELAWFESEVQRRAVSKGCVLVVRAVPTKPEDWPPCLKDERGHTVLGFWFHQRPWAEVTFPFGWPDPQPQDRQFYEELGKLATIVVRRLRELKEFQLLEQQALKPAIRVQIEGSPCIYLQARSDDEPTWLAVRKALQEGGYQVKPDRLPRVTDDLAAMQVARRQRIADLSATDALLVLHASGDHSIELEIKAAANDRADLKAFFNKELPCALLDQMGGNPAIGEALGFHRIDARERGWLLSLQVWLASALASAVQVGP